MHRMGKSYKKPGRPFDQRVPSGEAKEKFKWIWDGRSPMRRRRV